MHFCLPTPADINVIRHFGSKCKNVRGFKWIENRKITNPQVTGSLTTLYTKKENIFITVSKLRMLCVCVCARARACVCSRLCVCVFCDLALQARIDYYFPWKTIFLFVFEMVISLNFSCWSWIPGLRNSPASASQLAGQHQTITLEIKF